MIVKRHSIINLINDLLSDTISYYSTTEMLSFLNLDNPYSVELLAIENITDITVIEIENLIKGVAREMQPGMHLVVKYEGAEYTPRKMGEIIITTDDILRITGCFISDELIIDVRDCDERKVVNLFLLRVRLLELEQIIRKNGGPAKFPSRFIKPGAFGPEDDEFGAGAGDMTPGIDVDLSEYEAEYEASKRI